MKIKEAIVVEGRDDQSAVLRAVDANIICTHGYGINEKTIELIASAYEKQGIIIFTDPDHAGLQIRRKLTGLFPDAKQAYLTEEQATKADDIGIENASSKDIVKALEAAMAAEDKESKDTFTAGDLDVLGLSGPGSREKREAIGAALGIGSGNAKSFLKRLNYMGISREDLIKAWESFTHQNL